MKICVNSPFISRKTAIRWEAAGMTRRRHEDWILALKESLERNKQYRGRLKAALKKGNRLKLKVLIFGIPQRIKQLDIHDALSQIIDEVTNCLFPREKGHPTPQTEDRHFWKVEAEKFTDREEGVEIEVEQLSKEVRIFKKFSGVAPYQIDAESIWHEDPPKPDISCNLLDGTPMVFELVECIDESIARATSNALNLPKVFEDRLKNLPQEKQERLNEKFGNASILVSFVREISMNKRKLSIPAILDCLLTSEPTKGGKLDLSSCPGLRNVLNWIILKRRRGIIGPIFGVDTVTFFAEPAKERIEEKFNKKYKTESSIELLAYYELQPEIPESNWLPLV
jgi:hypothetical protein